MRAGYTDALAEIVERGARSVARLLVEIVRTITKDTKDAQADFDGADSLTGLTTLQEGGVRITGSDVTAVENAIDTGGGASDITDGLGGPWGDVIGAIVVEWSDYEPEAELHAFQARLDPNVSGGGVEVTTWVAQLFRLERVAMVRGGVQKQRWDTSPVSGQVRVAATGALSTVEFVFTVQGETPRVGGAPVIGEDIVGTPPPTRPTTIAIVWALKGEGEVAGNVAWRTNASQNQITSNGHRLSRYNFTKVNAADSIELGSGLYVEGVVYGLPRFAFKGRTFTERTITWTDEPLDLGAAPSAPVGMIAESDEVGGSSVTTEVWDGGAWIPFEDGDLVGVDNTPGGGGDLSSLSATQTQDVRGVLVPSPAGTATPILRRLGMEERTSDVRDELVVVRGYSVTTDPITLQSSIPTAELVLYKSGVRDYRDFATELLSSTFPEDLLFRLWWGHPTLVDRKDWLHLDDFQIRDVQPADGQIVVPLVHPIERLRRKIPLLDTVGGEREPWITEAVSLKAAYDALISGQLGLPGRLIGPGIMDTTTLVGKEVKATGPGVEELDRLHFLDGSTGIGSQGRYKTRPLFDRSAPRAVFTPAEIDIEALSAGYALRVTDYSVLFGWDKRRDAGRGDWTGQVSASASAAISRLGRAHLEEIDELDEETAKWIPYDTAEPPTSALATRIATRMLEHAAGGVMLWSWRTTGHPRPYLELGDRVAVPTDLFVGLDPTRDGQPLRGPLWAILRLVGVHNFDGTRFTGWVQDYTDVLPSSIDITRTGFADPKLETWSAVFGVDGSLSITGQLSDDGLSFRALSDAASFPLRAAVGGEALQTPDSEGYLSYELDGAETWDFDDDGFISLVVYEKADGSGSESAKVYHLKVTRDPTTLGGEIWVEVDTANESLDVFATADGPSSLFPATLTIHQDDPTGAALQVIVFAAPGDTAGPTGSGETQEFASLTDIALAKKGAIRFFGTLVSASGAVTSLYSMGDLDSLPGGSTTALDYATNPSLRNRYDDDVEELIIIVPGGKSKTFTGLSGGGLETYTVGDTLDDATTEADLGQGETRAGYRVTMYSKAGAAGLSLETFDGSLHGIDAAIPNSLVITGPHWYVLGSFLNFEIYGYAVNITPGPDTESWKVDYDPGTGAISYTFDGTTPQLHVLRNAGGVDGQNFVRDHPAFDITYTPYTGTTGTGTAGPPVTINTGDSDTSGAGTSIEGSGGTIVTGNALALRPTFDARARAADDEPELILRDSYSAGSKSGTWTPNVSNGMSQLVTASGSLTINIPTGIESGESFLLRIVTGSNDVTIAADEGPRLSWSEGTIWGSFHSFAGTVAFIGAAA